MLDPRFKKEGFRSQHNAQQAAIALENEITYLNKNLENRSPNEEPPTYAEKDNLFKFVTKKIAEKQKTTRLDSIVTMRQYLEQNNATQDVDPLDYWKINEIQFGQLAKCAKKILCIPGSSVESERVFSKAGEIVSQKRSRLKPKAVNMLLALKQNQWILE
ncbi:zinc finger BED domain-containing protein 4-like [Drosophila willistoni]|uniref:zinc finger BED domain-containing protein 4-like n=1 Tax=Drosophila willistoni TaxID=7260 RepID=UPI000C26C2C9|nr:zinc finger BED domain-containing protein 4-like [Drosophila willistoni]